MHNAIKAPLSAWNYVSQLGLQADDVDDALRKKVVLTNRLALMMLIMITLSTLIFARGIESRNLVYMIASLNLIPLITLVLNRAQLIAPSRLLFGVLTPIMVLMIIVSLKLWSSGTAFQVSEYHFYTPRYYLVAIGLLPLAVIDIGERTMFYLALVINVVCLLMFDFAHDIMGVGYTSYGFDFHQYHQAQIMPVVLMFFLYAAIAFYQHENRKFENEIISLNDELRIHNDAFVEEINLARRVVDRVIPDKLPDIKDIQVATFMQWSKEMGGDYYTVKAIEKDRYLMIVADVSGKGLAASIVVSTIHSFVETKLNMGNFNLRQFITELNEVLCKIIDDGRFVTAWIAEWDGRTNSLTSMNAGHPTPYLIDSGNLLYKLDKGGTILGFFSDGYQFETETVSMEQGSTLFVYSDGVTEAANPAGELYEENERLISFLKEHARKHPNQLLSNLQNDIRNFVGQDHYDDDLTCMVLKR